MGILKEVERSATVAFGPPGAFPPLLATGTMAGAIDLSFTTTACLEASGWGVGRGRERGKGEADRSGSGRVAFVRRGREMGCDLI